MSNYVAALQNVLADNYTLYLKTQNYHWNVEGPNFKSLHELFEVQYNDLFAANDEIAERIRTLGEKVDGSYAGFSKRATIKEAKLGLDEMEMVRDLFESNQQMIKTLKTALDAAQAAGDEVSADLLIGRITVQEKASWMLRSTLPDALRDKSEKPAHYAA